MAKEFNERILRLTDNVETRKLQDGTRLLKQTQRAEYLALTAEQQNVFDRFAGQNSVQQVLHTLLTEPEHPDIRQFYDLVLFAAEHGFLVDADAEEEPEARLAPRSCGWSLKWGWGPMWILFVIAALSGFVALRSSAPIMPVTVPGWVVVLGIQALALSLANVLAACVLAGFGRTVYTPQITFRLGLPFFSIDERDAFMGGRRCQAAVALQQLSAPLLILGCTYLVKLDLLFFGAILALFVLSSPFGETPAHRLLHALFRKSYELPRHAATFLGKKVLRHLFMSSGAASEEDYLLLYSTYAITWLGCFIFFVSGLIRRQGSDMLNEVILAPSLAGRIVALLALCILVIMFAAPFAYQAWLLIRNAYTLVAPHWFRAEAKIRRHTAEVRPDADTITDFLATCMLFAPLPRENLARIAQAMTFSHVKTGTTLIREGDRGDCLFVIYSGGVTVLKEDEAGREKAIAELKTKDVFGEIALLDHVPRTATVRSSEPTDLVVLDRATFEELLLDSLGAEEIRTVIQVCAFLRRSSMFATWPDRALQELAHALDTQDFELGHVFTREGEHNETFHVIYEGSVEVCRGGKQIARLRPTDFFGEVSLLKQIPAVAEVRALTHGRCLSLTRGEFLRFISQNVHTGVAIEHTAEDRHGEDEE